MKIKVRKKFLVLGYEISVCRFGSLHQPQFETSLHYPSENVSTVPRSSSIAILMSQTALVWKATFSQQILFQLCFSFFFVLTLATLEISFQFPSKIVSVAFSRSY